MDLQEEIARKAFELYKKKGCLECQDIENWLDAERMVLARHASQDMEEPEGEEALIGDETIAEEVEGTEPRHASQEKEEEATVIEEIEVREPFIPKKRGSGIREVTEKKMLAKKGGSGKKAAALKV